MMPKLTQSQKQIGLAIAAALAVAGACILLDRVTATPLTPERARAALAVRYPELTDAPITVSGSGFSVGTCRCWFATAEAGSGPAGVAGWQYLPPLPPNKSVQGWEAGTFQPAWFGTWKVVEGGVFVPLSARIG